MLFQCALHAGIVAGSPQRASNRVRDQQITLDVSATPGKELESGFRVYDRLRTVIAIEDTQAAASSILPAP